MSSGFFINSVKFGMLCRQTFEKYISLYPWFYMPVTLHKILVHGPIIIKRLILPIGLFSEDSQESRNKDIRNYREHHARKDSPLHTITDQFNRLLITSDPFISCNKQINRNL